MHGDSFKLKDFFDVIGDGLRSAGPGERNATWALDFLLKKMELTFSEKLLQLIEKKGRKPSEKEKIF
jgi:hypothetical protein